MKLILSGGKQRENLDQKKAAGHRYECAKLVELDYHAKKAKVLIEYWGNQENYTEEMPSVSFAATSLVDGKLYLPTFTEVFIYQYPELKLLHTISYPFFNNIHHAIPFQDYLVVASTGLDMLVYLDSKTFEPLRFVNVLGKDPWHKFDKNTDYRKVPSTQPHESHPNHTFILDGELWVSRFHQRDAVMVEDHSKRIEIGLERIHDGHVIGDYVYFTTVNGYIVIANAKTYKIEEMINLNEIEDTGRPLGWCRSLHLEGDVAYVAFSSIRQTRMIDNVKWILKSSGAKEKSTRVVAYNLKTKTKLDEYKFSKKVMDTIFSLFPK